jgi:hypothetical protein
MSEGIKNERNEETDVENSRMRVLLASDGSEPAGLAVDLVANVAWPPGSAIFVAQAVETGAGLFSGPWPALAMVQTDRIEAEIRAEAHRFVHEAHRFVHGPALASKRSSCADGRRARNLLRPRRP